MIAFTDNEGCLTAGKGIEYDLNALLDLKSWLEANPQVQLVVCTGRSAPYCEALLQAVGLQNSELPIICEGGAALYHPDRDQIEPLSKLAGIEERLKKDIAHDCFRIEPGKVACLSLYPESPTSVEELYQAVMQAIGHQSERYSIRTSAAAVDITSAGISKSSAIQVLAVRYGWDLSTCFAFGDADNDLPMLHSVGYKAAPANANTQVKEVANYVSTHQSTRGLIDALTWYSQAVGRSDGAPLPAQRI